MLFTHICITLLNFSYQKTRIAYLQSDLEFSSQCLDSSSISLNDNQQQHTRSPSRRSSHNNLSHCDQKISNTFSMSDEGESDSLVISYFSDTALRSSKSRTRKNGGSGKGEGFRSGATWNSVGEETMYGSMQL